MEKDNMLKGSLEQKQVSDDLDKSGNNKVVVKILAILVTLIIIIGLGVGVYFIMSRTEDTSSKEDNEDQDEQVVEVEEETEQEEKLVCDEGWKKYMDTDFGFEFCYPQDWNTEYQQGEPGPGYLNLSVNNGKGYNIDFTFSDESYPQYCIYPDTDENLLPEDNGAMEDSVRFDDYNEVKENGRNYRWSRGDVWGSQIQAIICKQNEEGIYITKLDPVYSYFRLPIGEADDEQVDILEKILLSFRKVEKDEQEVVEKKDIDTWETYESEELGIKFKYPEKFNNIEYIDKKLYLNQSNDPVIYFTNIEGVDTSSEEYKQSTFMVFAVENKNPIERKVKINGKEYVFDEYYFAEGSQSLATPGCVDSSANIYLYLEVKEKIAVTLMTKSSETCNEDGTSSSYSTAEKDIEDAISLISTIEFEE